MRKRETDPALYKHLLPAFMFGDPTYADQFVRHSKMDDKKISRMCQVDLRTVEKLRRAFVMEKLSGKGKAK